MIGRSFSVLLALAYPILVFFVLAFWDARALGVTMLALGLLRVAVAFYLEKSPGRPPAAGFWMGAALIALGIVTLWSQSPDSAKIYPVAINLGMLLWFGLSLINPPTVIETMARFVEPDLPAFAVLYTRKVTWAWCVFFSLNGSMALYTSLFSSLEFWMLYNGMIAYLLMGSLFAIEYLIRIRVRSRHEAFDD